MASLQPTSASSSAVKETSPGPAPSETQGLKVLNLKAELETSVFIRACDLTIAQLKAEVGSATFTLRGEEPLPKGRSFEDLTFLIKNLDRLDLIQAHYKIKTLRKVEGNNLFTLINTLKKIRNTEIGAQFLQEIVQLKNSSTKQLNCILTHKGKTSFVAIDQNEGLVRMNFCTPSHYVLVSDIEEGTDIEEIPFDIVLFHELVHAYNWLKNSDDFLQALKDKRLVPKYYSNREEYRAIEGINGQPYYENAYRVATKKLLRISHTGYDKVIEEVAKDYHLLLMGREEVNQEKLINALITLGLSKKLNYLLTSPYFKKISKITADSDLFFSLGPLSFTANIPKKTYIEILQILKNHNLLEDMVYQAYLKQLELPIIKEQRFL